jgi:hypothetical protein
MKMKRFTLFLLTATVAVSTLLIGCDNGNSPIGDTTPPAEVTSLTATPGNGQVTLNWTDPADSDFNEVEITFTPAVTGITQPIIVAKGTATKVITGLTNDTEYTFTIKTKDDTGNTSIGTTATATPVLPTQTAATPTGNQVGNKVFLTTTTSGATIYYSIDGSAPTTEYVSAAGIVVKTGTVVKAKATKSGWLDSETVTVGTYTAKYNRVHYNVDDTIYTLPDAFPGLTSEETWATILPYALHVGVGIEDEPVVDNNNGDIFTFLWVD